MAKITWANRTDIKAAIGATYEWAAAIANEVKTSVNALYDSTGSGTTRTAAGGVDLGGTLTDVTTIDADSNDLNFENILNVDFSNFESGSEFVDFFFDGDPGGGGFHYLETSEDGGFATRLDIQTGNTSIKQSSTDNSDLAEISQSFGQIDNLITKDGTTVRIRLNETGLKALTDLSATATDIHFIQKIFADTNFLSKLSASDQTVASNVEFTKNVLADKLAANVATILNALDIGGGAAIGAGVAGSITAPANGLLVEGNVLGKKQITVQGSTISFTATPTFNFDSGNVQKMIVTATITSLSISNELDSGSYRIFLQQNGTGNFAIPTPDASFGTKTDNSADFITAPDDVNIIDIAIDPDGTTYFSIETITA